MEKPKDLKSDSYWRSFCQQAAIDKDSLKLHRGATSWRNLGGAYRAEPWLYEALSALTGRAKRTALNCCDTALELWVEEPAERSQMLLLRGLIVAHALGDPRSGVIDVHSAGQEAPPWLRPLIAKQLADLQPKAEASRIRKPRAKQAPEYDSEYVALIGSTVSTPRPKQMDHDVQDADLIELWRLLEMACLFG